MKILGIDPGLQGGLALKSDDGILVETMPITPEGIDIWEFANFIDAWRPDLVVLERAQPMPKQGISSTFNYGRGFGGLEGVLAALKISYTLVAPKVWCKVLHTGIAGENPKDKSRVVVARLYPHVCLKATDKSKKPHEGMMDALLIAHWGWLQRVKGEL